MDEVSSSAGAVIEMKCHCTATFLTHHNQGQTSATSGCSLLLFFTSICHYSGMLGEHTGAKLIFCSKNKNAETLRLWNTETLRLSYWESKNVTYWDSEILWLWDVEKLTLILVPKWIFCLSVENAWKMKQQTGQSIGKLLLFGVSWDDKSSGVLTFVW